MAKHTLTHAILPLIIAAPAPLHHEENIVVPLHKYEQECNWWRCSLIHNCISKCSMGECADWETEGRNKRTGGNSGQDLPTRAQPCPSCQPPCHRLSGSTHGEPLGKKKKTADHSLESNLQAFITTACITGGVLLAVGLYRSDETARLHGLWGDAVKK